MSGNAELASIDHAHNFAAQAIINKLASHGLLNAGDTGYREGLESQQYGNNVCDAQQKVLSDLLGYQQSALQQKQSLQNALTAAIENAWQSYIQNPGAYGTGGPTQQPSTAPATTTAGCQSRWPHHAHRGCWRRLLDNAERSR